MRTFLLSLFSFFTFLFAAKAQNCQAYFYYMNDTVNNNIIFYDASSNATNWQWNFGDGNASTLEDPNHLYSSTGVYYVCLTITDSVSFCTNTYCDSIFVGGCFAAFTYFPDVIPNSIRFYENSGITNMNSPSWENWEWNFGDGMQSTDANPFHIYAQSGIYYVCLTYSDSNPQFCLYTRHLS